MAPSAATGPGGPLDVWVLFRAVLGMISLRHKLLAVEESNMAELREERIYRPGFGGWGG